MKLYVYAVKDRATDLFGNPMFFVAPGQAHRAFSDEVNRPADDNQYYKHPDDYDLHELGMFDSETGSFDVGTPRVMVRGKDVALKN